MVKEIETKKDILKRTKKALFLLFALLAFYWLCMVSSHMRAKGVRGARGRFNLAWILILLSFFISPLIPIIFSVVSAVGIVYIFMKYLIQRILDGGSSFLPISIRFRRDQIKLLVVSFLVLFYLIYLIFSKRYEFPYTFIGIYNILKS